ncbi:ash family protein [Salmonella enterica subsp. enterica]|nr:ash family protein [Salmonella enterica subsp. enterica serovar Sandiego]
MMFSYRQQKMCLIKMLTGCYFSPAATLLAVGRSNPVEIDMATLSALSAFFVVVTIALAPFYGVVYRMFTVAGRELLRSATDTSRHHVMVALAGPLSGGPGSMSTGIATPVRAIASECSNSSDSCKLYDMENCHHAQTPQKPYPRFGRHHYHPSTQPRLSAQAGPCKNTFISFVHRNTGWQSSSSIHSLYFFLHPR